MPSKSAIKKQRQRERQRQQHLQQKRHQSQHLENRHRKQGGKKRKKELTSEQLPSSSAISLASSSFAEGDSDATTESPLLDESVALVNSGSICVSEAFLSSTLVKRLRADARSLYDFGAFTAAGLKHEEGFPGGGGTEIGQARRNSRDESAAFSDFRDVRVCSSCGLFDDAEAASEHARILRGADTAAGERKKKMPKIPTDGKSNPVGPKFDEEAREELFARMADLREQLQRVLGRPLSPFMELQYLRYPGGGRGFYGRHVDQQVDEAAKDRKIDKTEEEEEVEVEGLRLASKRKKMTTTKNKKKKKHGKNRSVSMLIYLNNNAWDVKRDGGALRAYLPPAVASNSQLSSNNYQSPAPKLLGTARDDPSESKVRVVEIAPRGGTVVLFDSRTLEHEATPTLRTRWALVGWFMDGE